ncbi:MAG: LAGLIDADG family homing endonuclease [Candidatus Portnoybacteria bacterium]|nr:LAGLIDADG family homing endonuclease [Candidatus Portnoybacteria bacterium]
MPAQRKEGTILWSPELAYVLGLIATDGCLSGDGRHIDFTSKDIELIETLKRCLKISNKIGKKYGGFSRPTESYRVQFSNVIFYRWLLTIGLMPNKTKSIGALKVSDDYFFDFLRGHIDGDGTIRRYFDPVYPNSLRVRVTFLSSSLEHLTWLWDNIRRLCNVGGFIRQSERVYHLTFGKKDSLGLLSRIYQDPNSPRLYRKYLIIHDLLPAAHGQVVKWQTR